MTLVDDLRAEGCLGSLDQVAGVLQVNLELVGNLVQVLDGALGCQFKTICNPDGMDSFVKKVLRLFKKGTTKDDNTCNTRGNTKES